MPTYDYECKHCGHSFEHFQSMSDDPLAECPECGGVLRRLIGGGSGIIFKGSGFHVTDNRGGKNGKQNGSSKSETTTESTSETKKDAVGAGANSPSGGETKGKTAAT
ncbi:MAG: FmdB family zinc ribbon protein [Spirochaetota bacterium]